MRISQARVALCIMVFAVSLQSATAWAQTTKGERELRREIQEMRDRRDEAARTQRGHEEAAAAGAAARANQQELNRLKATQAERDAASFAESARQRAAAEAEQAAYVQRRTDFLSGEQRKSWLAEVADLAAHPPPVAAPGSYTECDREASAGMDETRPLGLEGAAPLHVTSALAACRAEVAHSPQSARAQFELGWAMWNGLVHATAPADVNCTDTISALRRAETLGSGAAATLIATISPDDCKARATAAFDMPLLRKAIDMGNPNAALSTGTSYMYQGDYTTSGGLKRLMTLHWKQAVTMFAKRADLGDMYAIYMLASMANDPTISFYAFDYVQESNHWVNKCLARRYKPCEGFIPKQL